MSNVIKANFTEPPALSSRRGSCCQHLYTSVDANARKVTCRNCKADLDPITVIDNLARSGDALVYCQKEQRHLEEDIERLKKEKAALQAYVRSTTKRLAASGRALPKRDK